MRKLVLTFGLASFASLFLLSAPASAILVDDFSDGNDVGWVRGDSLSAGGPGVFDATTGSYHLSSTSLVSADQEYVSAAWQDSASDPSFSDGTFTVRVRMDNASTNASLFMRSDQLASPSAYGFSVNNSLDHTIYAQSTAPFHIVDSVDGMLCPYYPETTFYTADGYERMLSATKAGLGGKRLMHALYGQLWGMSLAALAGPAWLAASLPGGAGLKHMGPLLRCVLAAALIFSARPPSARQPRA